MATDWSQIISAGVGPIIVISACGLLCLAFYNRLAAVVMRLRAFHRERLEQQERLAKLLAGEPRPDLESAAVRCREVIGMLEVQTGSVIRRAQLIRRTLGCLLLTIALLAACSLALGLSIVWRPFVIAAVPLFIGGLMLLIAAMVFALIEIKGALDPVSLEGEFVQVMSQDYESPSPGDAAAQGR